MKRARTGKRPSSAGKARSTPAPNKRSTRPQAAPNPVEPAPRAEEIQTLRQTLEELRVAEEELREQNQELGRTRLEIEQERNRYQALFDLAPDAYLVTDVHSAIREANRAASALLEIAPRALLGKPLTLYIASSHLTAFRLKLHAIVRGPTETWETRLRNRAGRELDVEITTAPERNSQSETTMLRWLIRDITERRHAEEIVRQQADLLNLTHETIIVRDLDSRILFWNYGAQEMYGWRADQVRGMVTHELLQSRSPIPLQALDEALLSEGRWEGELVHTRRDGSQLIVHSRQVLRRNQAGEPDGILEINSDITTQKRNQEEIRALNTRLEQRVAERTAEIEQAYLKTSQILESITDSYIAFDPEWRVVEMNPVAERNLFAGRGREVLGQVFWDEFPQGQATEFYRQYHRAIAEQRPVHFEAKSAIANRWYEVHAYPGPEGLRVYLRDISERKHEEETRSRLAAIVESSNDAIIGMDMDGMVVNWNPAAEGMFGYTAAEIMGQPISIIYPPERADEFRTILDRVRTGQQLEHFETVRVRKDGRRLDVSVSISPIRDATGELVGAAKIVRDITAQKRIQESERFLADASATLSGSLDYQATLEQVAHLVVPYLADYSVLNGLEDGNKMRYSAVAAIDTKKESLLRQLVKLYPPDPRSGMVGEALQKGQPQVMSKIDDSFWENVDKDPELSRLMHALGPVSYMVLPLVARGRPVGIISLYRIEPERAYHANDVMIARDLAHRAGLAVDNARLYHESQAAIVARDQFLSIASHEVRTPLTVIQGYTQMLMKHARQAGAGPDARVVFTQGALLRNLENIEFAAARLATLISDLLDVSRMRERGLDVSPERVNLSELLARVVESVRGQKGHREHMRNLDLRVKMPSDEEVWGEWDRLRLEQVLVNLVDNAVKYSPSGGAIDVRLEVEPAGPNGTEARTAHISVRDEGIGITQDEMGMLFQPFIRTSTATARHYPGLGLGLAVSKEIIKRHGGKIWAESAGLDQGTTFHVVLPGVL